MVVMCLLLGFYGYKVTTFCDNNKKKVKKNKFFEFYLVVRVEFSIFAVSI